MSEVGHPVKGRIALAVNGEIRQEGDMDQMIWKVPEVIACLSGHFELAPGDVILSGTPAGVGPVERGDTMVAEADGLGSMTVSVVHRRGRRAPSAPVTAAACAVDAARDRRKGSP